MNVKKLYLFVNLLTLYSCSEEIIKNEDEELNQSIYNRIESVQSENDYRTNPENIKIILGRKLNNPYSVESMQDAFNYYNSLVEDSQFNNKVVNANYYHIKITPRNEQELEFLDSFENNQIQNYVGKKEIPVFF
ncbi:MAG: hypothetical protein KGZ81_07080 [Flavobacteriales bacterium]|nr:hypothetical protein [Flavobacteriales bacterium]